MFQGETLDYVWTFQFSPTIGNIPDDAAKNDYENRNALLRAVLSMLVLGIVVDLIGKNLN